MFRSVLLGLFVLFFSVSFVSGLVIDGDLVREENSFVSLEVTPHTSFSLGSHEQVFTVENKAGVSGDLCVAYVFDEPLVSGRVWLETEGVQDVTYYNQSCESVEMQNGTMQNCSSSPYVVEEEYVFWDEKTSAFANLNYQGRVAYYNVDPLSFGVGETRSWKVRYTPSPLEDGKWELYGWNAKNGASCLEAIQDGDDRDFLLVMDPWFNTSWGYHKEIVINASQVLSNIADFPVYVNLSDLGSDFFGNLTNCGEIRVTDEAGSELPREIVSCNISAESGELYFKGNLSGGSDVFELYYGNSNASDYASSHQYGAENVWSDYVGVYHFESDYSDSTSNSNDLTNQGASITTSRLGGAVRTGSGYVQADNMVGFFDGANDLSVTFYVDRKGVGSGIFTRTGQTSSNDNGVWQQIGTSAEYEAVFVGSTTAETSSAIPNEYAVTSFVFNNSNDDRTVFINGVIGDNQTDAVSTQSVNCMDIANRCKNGAEQYDIDVTEWRISDTVFSLERMKAEANNLENPGLFYAVSDVQVFVATESEGRSAILAGLDNSEISGSYSSYNDRQVHVRLANGSQYQGTFDVFVESGSKRWAFNYDETSSSSFPSFVNVSPVFWVWQSAVMNLDDIESDVASFVDSTN